ncbi:hypothetical protein DCAR_0521254 [Daucus carota subsp. sativus]|uniref:DUF6857 domain-containing protein n=1 Tax=Daucus carota subsp. sativus TaxID=79200 RepID=A0A162A4Q2_DAUCS|nr:hypothetical protein DCAR_0521254 [Daucus carota subsp. sativus]
MVSIQAASEMTSNDPNGEQTKKVARYSEQDSPISKHNQDFDKTASSMSRIAFLSNTIELGQQIETEDGNWFMEFLDRTMDKGLKKSKDKVKADARKIPIFQPICWPYWCLYLLAYDSIFPSRGVSLPKKS